MVITALTALSITACAAESHADLPAGSWRVDGEKGRQLIIARDEQGYRMALAAGGGWLTLEPQGDGYASDAIRIADPMTDQLLHTERFTVRFDEGVDKLMLHCEYRDPDGKLLSGIDYALTKVSDRTDGPPPSE